MKPYFERSRRHELFGPVLQPVLPALVTSLIYIRCRRNLFSLYMDDVVPGSLRRRGRSQKRVQNDGNALSEETIMEMFDKTVNASGDIAPSEVVPSENHV